MATRSALSDDGCSEDAASRPAAAAGGGGTTTATSTAHRDYRDRNRNTSEPYTTTSLDDALSFMTTLDVQLEAADEHSRTEDATSASIATLQASTKRLSVATPPSHQTTHLRTASHRIKPTALRRVRRKTTDALNTPHTTANPQTCASELRRAAHAPPAVKLEPEPESEPELERAPLHSDSSNTLHANAAMWLQQAAQQYEQFQQTEQLRATLASQVELAQLLDAQVQAQTAALLRREALTTPPCPQRPTSASAPPRVSPGCPYIRTEQLRKHMPAVYDSIDVISPQFGCDVASSVFSSSRTTTDAARGGGPVFELKSSAPVPSSVADLDRVLWKLLGGGGGSSSSSGRRRKKERKRKRGATTSEDVDDVVDCADDCDADCDDDDDDEAMEPTTTDVDSTEKWYSLTLATQFGDVVVHGASVVCRHVDATRVAFTFASSVAVAESDLVFGETGWFMLCANDPSLPPTSALFQTFYQLHVQHPSSTPKAADASSDYAYMQELVMSALGNRMRVQQQRIQNLLLQEKPLRALARPRQPRAPAASRQAGGGCWSKR